MTGPPLDGAGQVPPVPSPVFSPASYNLPNFKYIHLPPSEVRNAWISWIRWFESIMAAAGVIDSLTKKMQLMAMGGAELQSAYYGLPNVEPVGPTVTPYEDAKEKLDQHFSPKHHDSFERFLFWSMHPAEDESIEKFCLRVQQKAEKCYFGKTDTESRHIAILDKIIQYSSEELRQKLLEKEKLTLDDAMKTVNAHQSVRYQAEKMSSNVTNKAPTPTVVNRMYDGNRKDGESSGSQRGCRQCGYPSHRNGESCPAADRKCLRCNHVGHFRSVCTTRFPSNDVSNLNLIILEKRLTKSVLGAKRSEAQTGFPKPESTSSSKSSSKTVSFRFEP